eukprot:g2510.t1
MKIATFNMESFGNDRHDPEELQPRIEALRPKILELEADILCLQEVNAQKLKGVTARQFQALDLLLKDTPYQAFHRATSDRPSGKGPGDRHNLVVLSRYPIKRTESLYQSHAHPPLWHPKAADPPYEAPEAIAFDRPVLRTEIDIGGAQSLHFFGVHLRAPIAAMIQGGKNPDRSWKSISAWAEGYQLSVLKQTAQALELRLAVEALFERDENALVILAGDFNATSETGTIRLLRADPDDTGSPHLESRRLFQLDAALPPDERKTVIHRGKGQALDHILASPAMAGRTTDVKVFNYDLLDEVFDNQGDDYAGSYHAAMLAESRPGRDVVLRIADAMQLSVREINLLLANAGLAAEYAEYSFDEEAIKPYRDAVETILARHNPYPACVLDSVGNILMTNKAFVAFSPGTAHLSPEDRLELFFNPEGELRAMFENWEEVAWSLLDRQKSELALSQNPRLARQVNRAEELLRNVARPAPTETVAQYVFSPRMRIEGQVIGTFATIMRFESAAEVTLSEIRVELIFPADETSRLFFENLYRESDALPFSGIGLAAAAG